MVHWKADTDRKFSGAVYLDGFSEFNHVMQEEMEDVSRRERQHSASGSEVTRSVV